jgi:hypothetical protein
MWPRKTKLEKPGVVSGLAILSSLNNGGEVGGEIPNRAKCLAIKTVGIFRRGKKLRASSRQPSPMILIDLMVIVMVSRVRV